MQKFKLISSLHTGRCVDKPLSSQVSRVKRFSRTPTALKSQASPESLRGIFPHYTHCLYLFWALLQFVRSLSCDCVNLSNAKLNPICHLHWARDSPWAHHIFHVSRIRVKPAPSHKAVSQPMAGRTTARQHWLSRCHWVSRLQDDRMKQWPLSPATACRTSSWSMWKQPKQCPWDKKFL
jgi:hypothetical protein